MNKVSIGSRFSCQLSRSLGPPQMLIPYPSGIDERPEQVGRPTSWLMLRFILAHLLVNEPTQLHYVLLHECSPTSCFLSGTVAKLAFLLSFQFPKVYLPFYPDGR